MKGTAAVEEPEIPPRWARADWVLLGALAVLSVTLTWPLCRDFTTHLSGDGGDGWQTVWGFWWVRRALASGVSPFFTDLLHHPLGAPLVYQSLVLPEALWTLPFSSPLAAYNAALLGTFVFSAWGMYGLAREVAGQRGPAVVAAIAYAFAPYHFARALGHLNQAAIHWPVLYGWALARALRRPGRVGFAAPAAGACAALAGLANPYMLLACLVLTLAWAPSLWSRGQRPALRTLLARAAAALASLALVASPWLAALPPARAAGPFPQGHAAEFFSADLVAFVVPGARSAWGGLSESWWSTFSGGVVENGVQLGWALLALAVWAALRARAARPLLGLAAVGVLLSLGPDLRLLGRSFDARTPWDLLVELVPAVKFGGTPVRFAFWATLALPVCAALVLARIRARWAPALAAIAVLAEFWPLPALESALPVPPPMRDWAQSADRFAVIDLSGDSRALFHQMLHGKPLVGGYLTRTPVRNTRWLRETPVVRELFDPPLETVLTREDPVIDFEWGMGPPAPGMAADRFEVHWRGQLHVPVDGPYELWLTSDDGAWLRLDTQIVINNAGWHTHLERGTRIFLAAGAHPLDLDYREGTGDASVRLEWSGPGSPRAVVPAEALGGGLNGVYQEEAQETGLGREGGRAALRALGVRYVILRGDARGTLVERELELPVVFEGDGIRIFEVP